MTPRIAVIGFGELGSALTAGLSASAEVVVHTRRPDDGRVAAAGGRRAGTLAEAVADADVVLSAVPTAASSAVVAAAAPVLPRAALFADLTSAGPAVKAANAAHLGGYVDAAVLGAVAVSGWRVPIAASGPSAGPWRDVVAPLGLQVRVLDGEVGQAARLKLLRSTYLKGRDALVLELVLGARALGLEDEVLASIPTETAAFAEVCDRVVRSLAVHAGRRADELADAVDLLREAGVTATVAEAALERLRALAALGLREHYGGRRPDDAEAVLAEITARTGAAAPRPPREPQRNGPRPGDGGGARASR